MAKIEIESAFVEAWSKADAQHPSWGMKTAETHSRKNSEGKYETAGRTFRTVKVSRASGIDLSQFHKDDQVTVWGKEITEAREHEGKKFYDLIVWADRVELSINSPRIEGATETPAVESAPVDVWNTPSGDTDGTPF